jgi:hypothetical protein
VDMLLAKITFGSVQKLFSFHSLCGIITKVKLALPGKCAVIKDKEEIEAGADIDASADASIDADPEISVDIDAIANFDISASIRGAYASIGISSTFKRDYQFEKYYASEKWTNGLSGNRPNPLNNYAFGYMTMVKDYQRYTGPLISSVLKRAVSDMTRESADISSKSKIFSRKVILDNIGCKDELLVNMEVQLREEKMYDIRGVLQMCTLSDKKLTEARDMLTQAGKTKVKHDELYSYVPDIVSIHFLGFDIDKSDPSYIWDFTLKDATRTSRSIRPEFRAIYIELPKFWRQFKDKPPLRNGKLDLENWLYFFVMCRDKDTLTDFLKHSDELFRKYEQELEEAGKMESFIDAYEKSAVNQLFDMLMTPEEEIEEKYRQRIEEIEKKNARIMEEKDKVMEKVIEENAALRKVLMSNNGRINTGGFVASIRKFFSRFKKKRD